VNGNVIPDGPTARSGISSRKRRLDPHGVLGWRFACPRMTVNKEMPLYFAYGSNMDRAGMRERCPASKPLGIARLPRHRFMIAREGWASVARDARRTVWGVLWDLALADMPALDRYELVASRLYVKMHQPVLSEAGPKRALIYIARSTAPGLPRPGYMEAIIAAGEGAGLPGAYLKELAGFLPPSAAREAVEAKVRPRWASPLQVKPDAL
jgi:AIG2-like family